MSRYRINFQRHNFGFKPPLVQSTDVVFDTDIPFEDEHLDEFERAAWDALWKQNPDWQNSAGPIPGLPGWSSAWPDPKYVCID